MAKIHDMEVEDYLAQCVSVYPESIQEEFTRIAADLAYWNSRYAQAMREQYVANIDRKRLESRLYIEKRETLLLSNAKVTESMVSSAVDMDDLLHEAKLKEIETEVEALRLRGIAEAVRAKKDMVVSIGASIRAEMQGDPAIREMSRGRRLTEQ